MWRMNRREWLDVDDGLGAHVVARVADGEAVDPTVDPAAGVRRSEVVLKIAACFRSITFECPLESDDDRTNTLHQIDTLVDVLTEFRDALRDEAEHRARLRDAWDDYADGGR